MKLINEKGRLFGLINVVDLLVLLAILAVGAGLVWKFAVPQIAGVTAQEKLTFTARVRGVHGRMEEEIRKNLEKDPRCIAGNDYVSGFRVTGVHFEPYIQQVTTSTGRLVDAIDPTRLDAIFTVEGMVPKNTAVLKVGPQEIRAGYGHYLKTKFIEHSAVIETVDLE